MTQMQQPRARWCALLAAVLLAGGLSACVPLVVGGAAVGTMVVAVDRRTSGAQLEDEGIELRASNQLFGMYGERAHVNVTSWNRQVLITGEVPSADDKHKVEDMVRGLENVKSVVNELAVGAPSSLAVRSNDTFITGKVKASFVDAQDLQSHAIKVLTERSVVYLMGRVTTREANRAGELARSVSGVAKVVRVFEIISEEELRQSQPRPAPAPAGNTQGTPLPPLGS